jgi:hypothetical protein
MSTLPATHYAVVCCRFRPTYNETDDTMKWKWRERRKSEGKKSSWVGFDKDIVLVLEADG